MTNAVIGALRVNLGIDTAQFSEGLGKAQSSLAKFGKTVAIAAAAAGAAIAGALAVGVKNALNEADDMSKIAAKIGIPIEELSKLKYAADLSGVSLEALKVGVGKLAKNMNDVANAKGPKAFQQLGISVKDASGKLKSTSQVMAEISDKFKDMPNGARKTALAMELMGKSGADMIPLLNDGSAALNEMMAEAQALGLEISQKTASAAEQFNDNLSRMGYAVSGLTLGLTAALAPALAVISDAMVVLVKWILQAVQYLPVIAEYVAVAGGALAVMFSPAILAAVGSLIVAIGTGLVGAFNLLKVAILANPLGAIAVGIATAIVAIYHFRDAIKDALGIDVVQVVKTVGNVIIGTFVGAFDAIAATWRQLPAALGDLAYQAGYLLADNIRYWINEAIMLVDGFIGTLNDKMGTGIGRLSTLGPVQNNNPYKGAAAGVAAAASSAMSSALSVDYIGGITTAIGGMNDALGETGDILDDLGGGGGGKGGKGKDGKVKKLKEGFDKVGEAIRNAQESLGGGLANVIDGIINKTMTWKDALMEVGRELLKYMNQMNMAQGGKGLFGGGLLQGLIGGLVGFASGGTILPGGTGGIDSQLVAFRKSPNEQVDITKPGQRRGGATYAPVYHIDARGADQAAIARLERGLDQRDRNFGKMVDRRNDTRQKRRTSG